MEGLYNLFAKIYLYIYRNIQKIDAIINFGSFNISEIYQRYKDISADELENNVEKIIVTNKKDSNSIKYLSEILLFIDYKNQNIIDDLNIKRNYLNTLYQDKIQLFCKVSSNINRMSGAYPSLTSYFKSICPYVKNATNMYEIYNYYINKELENVKIALIPGNIFENESEKENKILNSIRAALENGHNIILCSEYYGSDKMDNEIYSIVCNYPNSIVIFCPSYQDNDKFNLMKIFYNEYNQIDEVTYKKHFPFTVKGELVENIKYGNAVYHLFHIKSIGTISCVICKDYFSPNTDDFIESAQVDLMLIMSMTENYSEFISQFERFNAHKRMSILCNDCKCVVRNKLVSPFLVGYYRKGFVKNTAYEIIDVNCGFNCNTYSQCYLSMLIGMDNGLLKIKERKHVLV